MNNLSQYIIEKLHLSKDVIKSRDMSNKDNIKNVINKFLSDNNVDKYEIIIYDIKSDKLDITIYFDEDLDNTKIHEIGYTLFFELFDEEKYKPYNRGSDWWVSSSKKICYSFELK